MKCTIPEIAWHNRDPVLSVDFQPKQGHDFIRLATGGCDSHVVIWYVKYDDAGGVNIEVAADLFHHQKAVNVVRWSPTGEYLASGDDESAIIIWRQKTDVEPPALFEQNSEQDRETWIVYKILRGHVEDVYDLSWCPMSKFIISGSVDNTAIVWDVHKAKSLGMLHHKGFVQGVMWDPNNQYLATMSSDRVFRIFDANTKKAITRSSKGVLPVPVLHPLKGQTVRFYHDDTLQSFFRRLHISPDGELIAVPTGFIEGDPTRGIKNMHTAYIYSRYSLQVPICVLPCGDSPALAVRWSPVKYSPRKDGPKSLISLPSVSRMILAVGTNDSITIYDTQQTTPLAVVLNPQYARLTDMTWSNDGNILIVSSSDGYCSIITFVQNDLGEIYCEEVKNEISKSEEVNKKAEPMEVDPSVEENQVKETPTEIIKDTIKSKEGTPKSKSNAVETSKSKGSTSKAKEITKDTTKPKENEAKSNKSDQKQPSIFQMLTPRSKTSKPKSLFGVKEQSEGVKPNTGLIDEAAMEPWSQDGFAVKLKNASPEKKDDDIIILDDPTQDIKLVYDDTEDSDKNSKKKENVKENMDVEENKIQPTKENVVSKVSDSSKASTDNTPTPVQTPALPNKTPRRVSFITLSSPKNKKRPA